jgi:hypothetical protein
MIITEFLLYLYSSKLKKGKTNDRRDRNKITQ